MTSTSRFLRRLLIAAASICLLPNAHAGTAADQAPSLTTFIVKNGVLTGVDDLEYKGNFYDVSFVGGSCNSAYSGCSASAMTFLGTPNNLNAVMANTALSEAIFYYNQSTTFSSIGNCANESCYIYTPTSLNATTGTIAANGISEWQILGEGELASAKSGNNPDLLTIANVATGAIPFSRSLPSTGTWAVWTQVASPVPEPQNIVMMAAGLLMLVFFARKANKTL